jgi:hypothetical protein
MNNLAKRMIAAVCASSIPDTRHPSYVAVLNADIYTVVHLSQSPFFSNFKARRLCFSTNTQYTFSMLQCPQERTLQHLCLKVRASGAFFKHIAIALCHGRLQ